MKKSVTVSQSGDRENDNRIFLKMLTVLLKPVNILKRRVVLMKYLLCYTEKYDEDQNVKVESEAFDDFADAVVRYTLMCGGRDNVVLADADNGRIISQFTRSRSREGSDGVPDAIFLK